MEHARTVSGRATRLERKRRYVEGSEGVRCVLNRRKKECVLNRRKKECVLNRRMKERTRKRRGERAFHADGQLHANGSVSREWRGFVIQYMQCAREETTKLLTASRKSPVLELGGGENEKWGPPFYPDMQRYGSQIVRSKRPSPLKKRGLVSHDYIAHLLKEGGFETVPCKNAYEANELLPIDEVRGFFEKVRDVIDHYHIKHQNVWSFDESRVSPEDKAPRGYVRHKKGALAA